MAPQPGSMTGRPTRNATAPPPAMPSIYDTTYRAHYIPKEGEPRVGPGGEGVAGGWAWPLGRGEGYVPEPDEGGVTQRVALRAGWELAFMPGGKRGGTNWGYQMAVRRQVAALHGPSLVD